MGGFILASRDSSPVSIETPFMAISLQGNVGLILMGSENEAHNTNFDYILFVFSSDSFCLITSHILVGLSVIHAVHLTIL